MSLLLFQYKDSYSFDKANYTENAVGAAFSAESAAVTVQLPGVFLTALGPHGLPVTPSDAFFKSSGETAVSIVGAGFRAVSEELEGTSSDVNAATSVISFGAGEVRVPDIDVGVSISNESASTFETRYEIDDRTGFKKYPHWHPLSRVVEDGYGYRTDIKSADSRHPQDFVRARGNDKAQGPQFAEGADTFISTSVGPEDL